MVTGVFSKEIFKIPHLATFLQAEVVLKSRGKFLQSVTAVAGWGLRSTSVRTRRYAQQHSLPYLALEDGFLRSVGLGNQNPPLSLIVDEIGIYYDATRQSSLELLIPARLTEAETVRANDLIASWRVAHVSKYNHLREYTAELPALYVLVVDQTFGDASIEYGLAQPQSFQAMLDAALKENPDCDVLVKIHPDVFSGRKQGHFDVAILSAIPKVTVIAEDVHPVRLLEFAQTVYVVTSQMGFEALLWGKPVRTFGMPFYAGWGLTKDELPTPDRRKALLIHDADVSLTQLVYASLIAYPRYVNSETGEPCEVEDVLKHIALQRQMRNRFPAMVYALSFFGWKRPIIRSFLQNSQITFVRKLSQVPERATLAVWGNREIDPVLLENKKITVLRLEDGFLRSIGLGVDLIRPVSWVVDQRGIYYDATRTSDLEYLLQTTDFSAKLINQAQTLRQRIVEHELTKYNVGTKTVNTIAGSTIQDRACGRKIILVPGQVETDASLAFGAPNIRHNMALLRAVRAAHPDAYLIYKPHPDVFAGLRAKGENEELAKNWCDEIVVDRPMGELLLQVDEVHVLTSLTGFEALLRGKQVTCYGQPFYAGWGLTTDMVPVSRRVRRLSLDELVTATLLLYPTYVSRITQNYLTAEQALDELLAWRASSGNKLPQWRKALRPVRRVLRPLLFLMGIR